MGQLLWQFLWLVTRRSCLGISWRQWCGRAVFLSVFRRPMLSALQCAFHVFGRAEQSVDVVMDPEFPMAVEELAVFVALLPLCFSDLRAPLAENVVCTDASETGCGSAMADAFIDAV
eukprot:6476390-Amphidinium_carterae.1